MSRLILTLIGLVLCLPATRALADEGLTYNDTPEHGREASLSGVVKTVDGPGNMFTVTVEQRGDVQFRVSPQTRFESEMLGGVIGTDMRAGLAGLRTGDEVKVHYLTLPPGQPIASEVEIDR